MTDNPQSDPDKLKMDHNYDGIEEYDNPLPGWWKWLFVATIVFTPMYWIFYHSGAESRTLAGSYGAALAENTRLQYEEIGDLKPDAETIARFMGKDNWLTVGKLVFRGNCVSCHGSEGEGKVGPNLTDEMYKNVKTIDDIAKVVANGAGAGAMPQWANRLHGNDIVLVSAYVASLRGKNLESSRPAEGNKIPPWPEPPPEEEEDEKQEDAGEANSADSKT